jgi:hypothetical protein
MFLIVFVADNFTFPEFGAAIITAAIAFIFTTLKRIRFPIRPCLSFRQMFTLLTNLYGLMVLALTAWAVSTHLAFTVHIPITTVSAKLTLTRSGTYTWAFLPIILDPIAAFIFFTKPFENTLTAFITVDVVRVFDLVIRFQNRHNHPRVLTTAAYTPQNGAQSLFPVCPGRQPAPASYARPIP